MDQQKLESQLVRAYAEAWNKLDPEIIFPLLADDVIYESQNVFKPLNGKSEVEDYLRGKMQTLADAGDQNKVYAEIGYCGSQKESSVQLLGVEGKPVVVMAQGKKDLPVALVLLTINERDQIQRIDVCSVVPSPGDALRTGEYPGMEDLTGAGKNAMQENESQAVGRHLIWFDAQRHEYLRVAKEDLIALNIWQEMSPFSFEDEKFAYLEEDADAEVFISAAGENDWILSFENVYLENFPIIEEGGKPLYQLSEDLRCYWCREERYQFCDCPRLTCPICGVEAACGEEVSIEHFSCGHLLAGWDDSGAAHSVFDFDLEINSGSDLGRDYTEREIEEILGELKPFYEIFKSDAGAVRSPEFWKKTSEMMPQIKELSFYHQPSGARIGWEASGYFAENSSKVIEDCSRLLKRLKKGFRDLSKISQKK